MSNSNSTCQVHGCDQKAKVRGFCWPHYRMLSSRYVELYQHLEVLYEDYGYLFERAVRELLESSRRAVQVR